MFYNVRNEDNHTVINILGIKFKFKIREKVYNLKEIFKLIQESVGTKCAIEIFKNKFGIEKTSDIFLDEYIKKVSKLVDIEMKKLPKSEINVPSDCIWSMWWQDDRPPIVEACLNSIKKIYPNLIVITNKNINNYINVPSFIQEKFENEKMRPALFSDYIRSSLLDKYGGVWLDSTLLLQQQLPEDLQQEKFCMLKYKNGSISNWLIKSNKNNYLIKSLRIYLEEYWKNEDFSFDYFMFHKFFVRYVKQNKIAKENYAKMKHFPSEPAFMLINKRLIHGCGKLAEDYDEEYYQKVRKSYFVQKLTYRDKNAALNPNSYYWHIVNEYTNNKEKQYAKS